MVGNDIVGIHQVSLSVVFHLISRCRPSPGGVSGSRQQGENGNYGVFVHIIYIRQDAAK